MSASIANTASSTSASRGPTRSRANKQELIKALASELKKERAKAAELADEVEVSEEQVNAAHAHLMRTQAKLVEEKERKDQTITLLRQELKKLRANLDTALHCDEVEAAALLALLEDRSSPPPTQGPRNDHPYSAFANRSMYDNSSTSFHESSIETPQPLGPRRPARPGRARQQPVHDDTLSFFVPTASAVLPPALSITSTAQERVAERMKAIQDRLAEREQRGAFVVTEKRGGDVALAGDVKVLLEEGQYGAGLKSEFKTSMDEPRASAGFGIWSAGHGLGKAKTWSKLFPGAYTKR